MQGYVRKGRPSLVSKPGDMGVESGGGGTGHASPAVEKSAGDVPPEMVIFLYPFS